MHRDDRTDRRVALILALATAAFAGGAASPLAAGEMNISQFVFRDTNRNGIYDRGEPPYAGLPIRLEQGYRDPILRESNLAGFANFPMSADDPAQDITQAGEVSFSIVLPRGLELTTGNPVQVATITPQPEAPGGFAMDPPNPFMGVAPTLSISTNAEGLSSMTCTKDGEEIVAEDAGINRICFVTAGTWHLRWEMADGTTAERAVTVDHWALQVPAASVSPSANGQTISFDDFLTSENIIELPSFDGYLFHNFVVAHRLFYEGDGYVNSTVSGEFAAYNSSGHPATIRSETPFGLHSVSVGVAWPAGMEAPVRFTALRGGEVVGRQTMYLSYLGPTRFVPDWQGIDEIRIEHDTHWQFVIDDLVLTR